MASVATKTVTKAATAVSSTLSATASNRAPDQGGVLDGVNPTKYNASNPIILFIIQAGIIIIFCRLLHYPLSKVRQPRVIAEVIGGIILGPSVMMRIPGFQAAIFPTASLPVLNNVANLGLILFLFLVALEVDMRLFVTNWRIALSVGLASMILPFGLGCAVAWGLYNQFRTDSGIVPIGFGVYMLFIGTALAITAFPVLCRILTELKLLHTPVGVTVLAAGVGNDVTGWILLALCVALVNNGSGITALWVLLCAIGWILFLVFAVRPCFMYLLRRSGSLQNGPTQSMVALTVLLALTSAWFTGIIGIHPIFGGFLVGLICPHDGGFAIKLTEKIEDLVSVLFLPLYFALSGLSTNLGLLNDGITWAYVVGVIAVAFSGKIIGGTLAARSCNLVWRESFSIGVLMSCKGLVELIVLNIGLQAKILSTRTFTIFVVMALVTTVATTPLTSFLYPPWYQKKLESWKRGEIDWDGNRLLPETHGEHEVEKLQSTRVRRLLVYLRLESLPSLFTFINLLSGDGSTVAKVHKSKEGSDMGEESSTSVLFKERPLEVHGVRILELTERTSSVMKVTEVDEYAFRDPVVNTFRTFAQLNNVAVSGGISIVPESSYAETLTGRAADTASDLVLIPWSEDGSLSEGDSSLVLSRSSPQDRYTSGPYNSFIQSTFDAATCNTAVFINRSFGGSSLQERPLQRTISNLSLRSHRQAQMSPVADRSHHIFLPFFGGLDDRVALRFVLQLAQNSNITATIVHILPSSSSSMPVDSKHPVLAADGISRPPSSYAEPGNRILQHGSPEDHEALVISQAQDIAFLHTLRDSLPAALTSRVVFSEHSTSDFLSSCLGQAKQEVGQSPRNAGDLIVVGRGKDSVYLSSAHAVVSSSSHSTANAEVRKTLGIVAESLIMGGLRASVLVVQAAGKGLES
ncbi:MAG: K(+)/H(+) antiporter [Claussenomyces sp. TS43310]|nr:MAG: K(+)/H(+) antiporter [Claussenomyces sp. TS43310]